MTTDEQSLYNMGKICSENWVRLCDQQIAAKKNMQMIAIEMIEFLCKTHTNPHKAVRQIARYIGRSPEYTGGLLRQSSKFLVENSTNGSLESLLVI